MQYRSLTLLLLSGILLAVVTVALDRPTHATETDPACSSWEDEDAYWVVCLKNLPSTPHPSSHPTPYPTPYPFPTPSSGTISCDIWGGTYGCGKPLATPTPTYDCTVWGYCYSY